MVKGPAGTKIISGGGATAGCPPMPASSPWSTATAGAVSRGGLMLGAMLAAAEALSPAALVVVATWAVATVFVALDSAGAREGAQAEASTATKNAHSCRVQRRKGREIDVGFIRIPKTLPELARGSNRPLV